MIAFDYLATRADADELIQEFGMPAALRRGGVDRPCWIAIVDYMTRDAATELTNPTDRRVVMSVGLGDVLDTPPDNERDQLVTYRQPMTKPPIVDQVMPMTCTVKLTAPAGVTVLYEFTVRR